MHADGIQHARQQCAIRAHIPKSDAGAFFNLFRTGIVRQRRVDVAAAPRKAVSADRDALDVSRPSAGCRPVLPEGGRRRGDQAPGGRNATLQHAYGGVLPGAPALADRDGVHAGVPCGAMGHGARPGCWRWHGRPVRLVDGTTVAMPDTAANQAAYPQPRSQRPGLGFPLCRVVGLLRGALA